jgi:LacI family transcriptional regulator
MTTIKDIAKAAGVSITTVSRALNGFDDVNKDTKERINKIAQELSYTPNAVARSLVSKRTRTIGVILSEMKRSGAKDAFAFEVLCGINDRAAELNYDILLFSTNPKKQMSKSYISLCRERNVEGAILSGFRLNDQYLHDVTQQTHFPCVLIDIPISGSQVAHITTNNVEGAFAAVSHLTGLGHKHIAMINGHAEAAVSQDRLKGYQLALEQAGFLYDPGLVFDGGFNEEAAAKAMQQILVSHPLVTAVFCASDLMALGAMKTMENGGIQVPQDMSIVGYDDISLASYCSPKLTTIRQDKYEMGYQAAELLINILENQTLNRSFILSTQFIRRESTSPPKIATIVNKI